MPLIFVGPRHVKYGLLILSKLHSCSTLSDSVKLLEETIYEEGLKIFGYIQPKNLRNISGKSRRTLRSMHLVKLKNSLALQINSSIFLEQKEGLEQLLLQVKSKIRSFRHSERKRKKRSRFKRAQTAFKNNPYHAGKSLLDPKCKALRVDEDALNCHKRSTVHDFSSNTPLEFLQGLPSASTASKCFNSSNLKFEDFDRLLCTRRNGSSPGLNAIPYKVQKMSPN